MAHKTVIGTDTGSPPIVVGKLTKRGPFSGPFGLTARIRSRIVRRSVWRNQPSVIPFFQGDN